MEKVYAQALQHLLSADNADEKKVFDQFIAHLKAEGRLKLLPKIKLELERILARAEVAIVEVAHKDDSVHALTEATKAGITADHAQVNPSLVSGWRARKGSQLVDRSGKQALIELYQKITA